MTPSQPVSIPPGRSLANGANASASGAYRGWPSSPAAGAPPPFSPRVLLALQAPQRGAAVPLVADGAAPGGLGPGPGGRDQRDDDLALAESGRHSALALSELALPAGSRVRHQGRADPGSLRCPLAGPAPGPPGVRPLRGREDEHSGARASTRVAAARGGPSDAGRA